MGPHQIFNNLVVKATGDSSNPHLELYEGGDGALSIVIDSNSQVNFFHTGGGAGSQNVAIGKDVVVTALTSSVAIGNQATSVSNSTVAVGNGAQAIAGFSTAIGGAATVERQNGTAIGYNATIDTTGNHQVAIGWNSHAANWDAIAIGRNTNATGNGSIIIGHGASSATNSTLDSLAMTWNDGVISHLFAKTADSYINGDGGQLGIGRTSATAMVHIQGAGSTNATDALIVENSSASPLLHIQDDGEIGIGTSSPADKLHLDVGSSTDGIRVSEGTSIRSRLLNDTTNAAGVLELRSASGTLRHRLTAQVGGTTYFGAGNSTHDYGFNTSSPETSFHANVSGVLFRSTSGPQTLEIRGIGSDSILEINTEDTADGDAYIAFQQTGTTQFVAGWNGESDDWRVSQNSISNDANARIVVKSDGNVGIGTASADTKLDIDGSFATRANTPATLTSNTNDWAIPDYAFVRVGSDGAYNITGMAGGVDGRRVVICNVVGFNLTFTNNDVLSSVGNRFTHDSAASIVLGSDESIEYIYDATSQVWRNIHAT